MRILTISNLYPPDGYGGYERQTRELVDALKKRGHAVSVLTSPISTRNIGETIETGVERLLQLSNEYMPLTNDHSTLQHQLLQSRLVNSHNVSILTQHLEQFRPDVVLLCNLVGLGGVQLIATLNLLGVPWVWSLAEVVPSTILDLGQYRDLLSLTPIRKTENGFTIEGTFVSLSNKLYNLIAEDGCRLTGSLHVVPYWIDDNCPPPSKAFYQPNATLQICAVGYVSEFKGTDILLRAARQLVDRGTSNFVLNIYGAGEVDALEREAKSLDLPMVKFHGFRSSEELHSIYAQHDVMLFPAKLREPFGNVTLESAMRGCVPIISNSCGAADSLTDGAMCLQVNRDSDSFAEAVQSIIGGKIDLATLATQMIRETRQTFALTEAASKYDEILSQISTIFSATHKQLDDARMLAMYIERIAFGQLEHDLSQRRSTIEWMTNEIEELNAALTSAKQGVTAYEQALTGEQNKLKACEEKLNTLENSRIWKFRNMLQSILNSKIG